LVKSGALPALELDRAKARVSQLNGQVAANDQQQRAAKLELKTNLARAEKSMSSLSAQVQDSDILSPLDGVIVRRNIEPGQVVGPGEPLIEIADISHLVVQLAVDENDVSRVNGEDSGGEGSAVAVRFPAFKERFFTGRVERVSPDADRARGGFFVRVRLDEPPAGLRSGMRAEANIVVAEAPGAVLVPADSVAENSVWVVKSGRVERRDVKVGMRDVSSVEIVSGLNEGEDVVLTPPQDLSPGGLVAVKSIDYFGGGQRKGDTANAVAGLHNPAGRPGQGLPTARPKPATRVARAGELPND
jgi:RND family efflux transporter MFP subunit